MDSDHDFDWIPQDGAYCYASLARRLHVMSVEDEVHEEVTKNPIMHSKSEKRARAREPLQSRSFIQEIRDTNDVAARGALLCCC